MREAVEGEAPTDQTTSEAAVTGEGVGDGEAISEEKGTVQVVEEGEAEGAAEDPLAAEMNEEVEEKIEENDDITDSTPSTSRDAQEQVETDSEVGITLFIVSGVGNMRIDVCIYIMIGHLYSVLNYRFSTPCR